MYEENSMLFYLMQYLFCNVKQSVLIAKHENACLDII